MNAAKLWHTFFLEERPSIGLAFFRIFVAWTVGLHVIPSFFHLDDNYLSTAFKSVNPIFFTEGFLQLVQKSPDWMVVGFVGFFLLTWFFFLIGLFTQISGILLAGCCYYFYALNDFHIGTLSWDILLVTLFLMCLTPYPGDYFSIDALRKKGDSPFFRRRPFFVQRLLQLQMAQTFFYTGLYKITAEGNWLTANPLHILMNYPPEGVTKHFLLKEWLAGQPQLCYGLGIFIIVMEMCLPLLWFCPKTRRSAIAMGFLFHVLLILTLDVPAIFFFLFPAQMLLFIHPQKVADWIETIRRRSPKFKVVYDADCGFCRASIEKLKIMDVWGHLVYEPGPAHLGELKLQEEQRVWGGFDALRRMCWLLPMLYPLLPFVYLPGAGLVGRWGYVLIANNRYLLHRGHACQANQCFRK